MTEARKTDGDLQRLVALLDEPAIVTTRDGDIVAANAAFCTEIAPARPERLQDIAAAPEEVTKNLRAWAATASWQPAGLVLRQGDEAIRYRASAARLAFAGLEPRVVIRLRKHSRAVAEFVELNERIADLNREVTRRLRAESRLGGQLEVLELIARGAPLTDTLAAIARFTERESTAVASILLLDEEGCLRLGAAPSLPTAYNEAIDGLRPGPAVGSCGTAAHRREPVVVTDIANDPLWADFKALALEHDLHACWSTPVLDASGAVLATLANYQREPAAPSPDDERIMAIAGHLTAIAIERDRDAAELRERARWLEDANHRKNEFLAMLGHELRNPLSPMVTAVQLLHGDAPVEKRAKWVAILDRQLGLMRRLVDDLLEISRITRGKIRLQRDIIDLRDVVRAAHGVEGNADTRVHVALPDEAAWVFGDADRLQQVVFNLLHNARKFTPDDGRIDVAVTLENDTVHLFVRDTGSGIDPAELPFMFELFAQGPRALDRRDGGLGIGLTLVKSLVEAHAGQVSAHSEGIGQGTQFAITLPRAAAPAKAGRAEQNATAERALRIMVVDDDEDGAATLATLLRAWGHAVRVEHDGHSAVEACLAEPPELLLLDIGLPGLDGFAVARTLRERLPDGGADCTIVAHSGYGQEADRAAAKEAGCEAFIVKPVDVRALAELLRTRAERP